MHNWKLSTAHIQLHTMKNTALFNNKTNHTVITNVTKTSFKSHLIHPEIISLGLCGCCQSSTCFILNLTVSSVLHPTTQAIILPALLTSHYPAPSALSEGESWLTSRLSTSIRASIMVAVTENKHKPLCQIQRNTCRPTSTDNHTHLKQGAWL